MEKFMKSNIYNDMYSGNSFNIFFMFDDSLDDWRIPLMIVLPNRCQIMGIRKTLPVHSLHRVESVHAMKSYKHTITMNVRTHKPVADFGDR